MEVLIAVSILALVMVVLGQTMGSTARAYTNINETHLGFLVASDKLVEMQVYQQWPSTGESDSTVTRNGREWWSTGPVAAAQSPAPFPAAGAHGYYACAVSAPWVHHGPVEAVHDVTVFQFNLQLNTLWQALLPHGNGGHGHIRS